MASELISFGENEHIIVEGAGGREPGRIRVGGGQEAGGDGTGCGSHARAVAREE